MCRLYGHLSATSTLSLKINQAHLKQQVCGTLAWAFCEGDDLVFGKEAEALERVQTGPDALE